MSRSAGAIIRLITQKCDDNDWEIRTCVCLKRLWTSGISHDHDNEYMRDSFSLRPSKNVGIIFERPMSFMKGDLLSRSSKLVKGLAKAEPVWLKAMEQSCGTLSLRQYFPPALKVTFSCL
ncbi:hypothetical protein RND71_009619 [Anisodus tanguticus]|uniref:Uncharacterized protein n=1 Tax=Anisodus tanguticus TaxID=243964 RepID=A0AAE1SID8_9SOLA|nr:hypothetical protein RND71_009619 [Anisodus tanguticus]